MQKSLLEELTGLSEADSPEQKKAVAMADRKIKIAQKKEVSARKIYLQALAERTVWIEARNALNFDWDSALSSSENVKRSLSDAAKIKRGDPPKISSFQLRDEIVSLIDKFK